MSGKSSRRSPGIVGGVALLLLVGASVARAEPVNVAPLGTATQSTQHGAYGPERAIDGNTGNFTHTASGDEAPTWQVDLEMTLPIERIVIHNRDDCCGDRLRDITVQVLDATGADVLWDSGLLNPENTLDSPETLDLDLVSLSGGVVDGQIVRVSRTLTVIDGSAVLSLGEVEVFVDSSALPPAIATQPQGGSVDVGGCHVFSVGLINVPEGAAVSYQWSKDGADLEGETGERLILGGIVLDDAGVYSVVATVDGLEIPSDPAELVVTEPHLGQFGIASQSTTAHGGLPGRAIDGNTSGVWGDASLSHTADEAGSWWQVELYGESLIERIVLWNRVDCCGERLSNFRVSILDTEGAEVWGEDWFTEEGTQAGESVEVVPPADTSGLVVRVTRLGPDPKGANFVSLAEAEIFGEGPLPPPPDLPNLARACGVRVSQSSQAGSFVPEFAIDGNLDNFTHTANTDQDATWEIDLGADEEIARIILYNRTSCCGSRLRDITVSILDEADGVLWQSDLLNPENVLGAFPNGPASLTVDLRLEEDGPVVGRKVRVHRTADPDFSGGGDGSNPDEGVVLSLGEVEITGVPDCPADGDTHCEGLAVEGPDDDLAGTWTVTATASDESEDAISYIFIAALDGGGEMVVGPQAEPSTSFDLTPGDWELSVVVDDGELCLDVADDAACSELVTVLECPAAGDTHCGGLTVEGPEGDLPGTWTATATATDDTGDAVSYTFTAEADGADPIVVGPQAEGSATFELTVAGDWTITVAVDDDPECGDVAEDATCSDLVTVIEPGVGPFVRGDVDGSGELNITDGIYVFNFLFLGGDPPACMAAADPNGEGAISITSGIYLLNFLFLGGPEPIAPYPECERSSEANDETLGCETPHECL